MKYYKLVKYADAKLVGDYPQCQKLVKGFSRKEVDHIYDVMSRRVIHNSSVYPNLFCENIPIFKLAGRAKLTDFLSQMIWFDPMWSSKALNILKKFTVSGFYILPSSVMKKDQVYLYYLVKPTTDLYSKYIEWDRCSFGIKDEDVTIDNIRSGSEYDEISKRLYFEERRKLIPKRVWLRSGFPKDQALLFLEDIDRIEYFFSESLVESLQIENLTGGLFEEYCEILVEG